MRFRIGVAFIVLFAGSLAGCLAEREAPLMDIAQAPSTLGAGYRLAAGEKLKITVFGEPDVSGLFDISARGTVSMPLVGAIQAEGQTLEGFRSTVRKRLANGFVNNPRVAVEIATYRPLYVHGEVRTGGEFPFKAGARIQDAVAMAGGFS